MDDKLKFYFEEDIINSKKYVVSQGVFLTQAMSFASKFTEVDPKKVEESFLILERLNNDDLYTDENMLLYAYDEVCEYSHIEKENDSEDEKVYYFTKESVKFATGKDTYIEVIRIDRDSPTANKHSRINVKLSDYAFINVPYNVDIQALHEAMSVYAMCNEELLKHRDSIKDEGYIIKLKNIKRLIEIKVSQLNDTNSKKIDINFKLSPNQKEILRNRCAFYAVVNKCQELDVLPPYDYYYSKQGMESLEKIAREFKDYKEVCKKNPNGLAKRAIKDLKGIFNKKARYEMNAERKAGIKCLNSVHKTTNEADKEFFNGEYFY